MTKPQKQQGFIMRNLTAAIAIVLLTTSSARAAEVIHVYCPGGPLPAMKEAAATFGAPCAWRKNGRPTC